MMRGLSRRDVIRWLGGSVVFPPLLRRGRSAGAVSVNATWATDADEKGAEVVKLASSSDINIPPRGRSFMNFSFDFPEPSVRFEGCLFSFRVFTFENIYAMHPESIKIKRTGEGLELSCDRLIWAGGQQTDKGRLSARFRKQGDFIVWEAECEHKHPIKSIAAIVRGLPRGRLCPAATRFVDYGEDEVLFSYPHIMWSMWQFTGVSNFPMVALEPREGGCWLIDSLDKEVRPKRFFFQPAASGYRVELIVEEKAYRRSKLMRCPAWRLGRVRSKEEAFRLHQEHIERAYGLVAWERRADVPDWMRQIALVLNMHGMHWTGYVFNSYSRMLEILEWTATQIPPKHVLVYLPAWDGRYYWNYPIYEPDERMGGESGFRRLIERGQKLGFKFMPMFGANAANQFQPQFQKLRDGHTRMADGNFKYIDNADWDVDRVAEGWDFFMNLGSQVWREWLSQRISSVIDRFHVDAYFLDISHGYLNDARYDMYEGTRKLVEDLRSRYPQVLACGEAYYDGLLAFIPLFHVFGQFEYPPLVNRYVRTFGHLSHPAPGRGSSGVHELGFAGFDEETLGLNEYQIPTLSIVDDTFTRYRDVMAKIIRRARERAGI